MSIIHDFKSIASKLNRQEQKTEWDKANPKPDPNKVVWDPVYGYNMPGAPVVTCDSGATMEVEEIMDPYKVSDLLRAMADSELLWSYPRFKI